MLLSARVYSKHNRFTYGSPTEVYVRFTSFGLLLSSLGDILLDVQEGGMPKLVGNCHSG
jgi:hypothetical protein